MADAATTVGGTPRRIPISAMRLDWRNPRLPPEQQHPDVGQLDLALYIDLRYNPLEVASSIARHGFFESEPLIAVEEDGAFVIVEGNRRLTALLGLTNEEYRAAMAHQTRGWSHLDAHVPLPDQFPVVVVRERKSVAPLLGFRHISGIKEWEPFAQARYIADLVEDENYSLDQVAELVGRPHLEVKAMYRDHEILRQAREEFGLDTSRVEQDFGVFNAAMGIRNLRVYVGAPTSARVTTQFWPLSSEAKDPLSRFFIYVYGDSRGRGRVLPESRSLRDLGRVLADRDGRAETVLRSTLSLAEALENLSEPSELAQKRLNQALSSLQRVVAEGPSDLDQTAAETLEEIQAVLDAIKSRTFGAGPGGSGS